MSEKEQENSLYVKCKEIFPKRQESDNSDLDLQIADWFGTNVDTIDKIDLKLIEMIREYIWHKDWEKYKENEDE